MCFNCSNPNIYVDYYYILLLSHQKKFSLDNDNDNEFLFRRMNRKKKIVIHKINLQNKYAYIVKEITLIHKCRWHVTTLKQRVDCNIINR